MNVLDTNILMGGKIENGIVTYPVLQELDYLKTYDGLTGKQARDALHEIHKNPDRYKLIYEEANPNENVDDFLIRYAMQNDYCLQTLDLSLYLKATTLGCKVNFAYNGNKDYSGITYLTDEECAEIQSGTHDTKYPINHFLIYNKQAFIQGINGIEEISYHKIENDQFGLIEPRNVEQYCLFELFKREVPVIMAAGGYGTGKSYTLLNHAIKKLEDGKISKIVVVPNNSSLDSTMELAALPGGIWEKVAPYTNVLLDMLSIDQIHHNITYGKIEVIPMAVLRGRNLEDSVIWVNYRP